MDKTLPALQVLARLQQTLRNGTRCLLQAPPGSGKTTGIPLALLDEPWLEGKCILMLEPRRLAARAAATRMAETLGEKPGETVGYRIRFEKKVSAATRIEVLTEGILTRRLQHDPLLEDVGLIIFDEFHERNLQADLGLALALDIQQGLREDLRLLLMSATLEGDELGSLDVSAPRIVAEGRTFEVDLRYHPPKRDADIIDHCVQLSVQAVREQQGDILVFLPGGAEIRRAHKALLERLPAVDILPLYGDLPRDQQDHALRSCAPGKRKIVLASAIAETSLTIDGVRVVIDSGLGRRAVFDPNNGLTRLITRRISKASAVQRAGRAGRQAPGVCYRLWHEQERLERRIRPEVLDADLSALALELARWGITEPERLCWPDPPPGGAYAKARELLVDLGALDNGARITAKGREMADLGVHPRLAAMLVHARRRNLAPLACDLAALLSERDPLPQAQSADIDLRLEALEDWRKMPRQSRDARFRRIDQATRHWRQRLAIEADLSAPLRSEAAALLMTAYPDRIAQNRGGDGLRFLLANGRGARLGELDPLRQADYLVAAHLDSGEREGRIHLALRASAAQLSETLEARIQQQESVQWNAQKQAVDALMERRLGALVLARRPSSNTKPETITLALIEGIRRTGMESLPWSAASRNFQQRVLSLAHWRPGDSWPTMTNEYLENNLENWLAPYLQGCSRLIDLRRIDIQAILSGMLSWPQRQRLDGLSPTHLAVPSGSRIALRYNAGLPPILEVRIQELFGLERTPTVCGGEIPVNLHLLSPARRPIQITQDLAGFWQRTYPEVRKELKGRYPKHAWPEDPWSASPTARAKPRPAKAGRQRT